VAGNKIDALDSPSGLERLEEHVRAVGLPFHRISGVTGEGVDTLLEAVWREVHGGRARDAAEDADGDGRPDEGPDLITPARVRRHT
jgi:hypothetical protein